MGQYVVRYRITRIVGEFSSKGEDAIARGTPVIVRSERGVEWGEVLCPASEQTRAHLGQTDESGRILQVATPDDVRKRDQVRQTERKDFADCQQFVTERKLQMELLEVERLFGGERLIVYYLSEKRVDFRELVKTLAGHFRLRVEMRQVGIRDEAKLLADYGDCGKPTCCNTHLREMPPVTMKMAKVQKATLDPSKISGRCGRLKCCLRYEYETYEEYQRELPPVGATVVTKAGQGRVLSQEILARKVMVAYDDTRRAMIDAKDVLTVISTRGNKNQAAPPTESA
ncbi:MAG TPA: regulatory iron-sulfur-containing complex subunit RicT [Planctomycetaceae bacterium]|nr:regulatory iron-sulfur-containing complex subunit RicT [Planctomycetaceae bacterium]